MITWCDTHGYDILDIDIRPLHVIGQNSCLPTNEGNEAEHIQCLFHPPMVEISFLFTGQHHDSMFVWRPECFCETTCRHNLWWFLPSPNPISGKKSQTEITDEKKDENYRRKSQTIISHDNLRRKSQNENLRQKSQTKISDENFKQKYQTKISEQKFETKISDENLRRKSQTKIPDENLRRKS